MVATPSWRTPPSLAPRTTGPNRSGPVPILLGGTITLGAGVICVTGRRTECQQSGFIRMLVRISRRRR